MSDRNIWYCDHCKSGPLNDRLVRPASSPGLMLHLMCPTCRYTAAMSGITRAGWWEGMKWKMWKRS